MRRQAKRFRGGFEKTDSGRWVNVRGKAVRLLADDNDGSRHQRFIVKIRSGDTLLIAHNIDLVKRVPLSLGDRVEVYGMYEWNELGGLIHWTHHDPMGIEPGGYIRHAGIEYR